MGTNSSFCQPSTTIILVLIVSASFILYPIGKAQCWLFSPRITPYYYPFPYPVPASILPSGSPASTSVSGGSSLGSSISSGYIGQSSIGSTPSSYNYNWYNYQNYPNSGVLYPSSGSFGIGSGIGGSTSGSLIPVSGGGSGVSSFLPAPGSLLRSWWTRKFSKFGLRSPGSLGGTGLSGGGYGYGGTSSASFGSPCIGYWSNGSIGSPCLSPNLCCYPLVVQTNVESTSRPVAYPQHSDSSSVTYPSTGYIYQPSGYKSTHHQNLSPQASENDQVVDSSS